jgi:hypothetical protein
MQIKNKKIRQKKIQDDFRQKLGLIVDQPNQGFGSTNDGNTARRFFEKSLISASITGFDLAIIRRFHVTLQVISCGHDINVDIFREYNIETVRKYVELYPWFPMSPTVHKILIHGHEIVSSVLLPIGQLSEEAQESCNKFIKKYRVDNARKCSRTSNIETSCCVRSSYFKPQKIATKENSFIVCRSYSIVKRTVHFTAK